MASLRLYLFLLCYCFVLPCLGITCAPGQKKAYRKEKCEPCEDDHFQPVASSNMFCSLCSVCNEKDGSEYVQQCTKTADAKCRCRVGFIPVDERNDLCQCPEGSGLTKTDSGVQCRECGYGYFTSKPDTLCVKWKDCAPWGVKSGGSKTSDVVCNNGSEVTQTGVRRTTVNLNYSRSSLTSAETSPTTATASSTLTPPLSHTTTTTTTSVNDTNYSSGLILYVLSLILLIPLSAVSCKQVIIPCMKRHMKKMNKTDGACRRPVEECGDISRSSLVKSSQGGSTFSTQASLVSTCQQDKFFKSTNGTCCKLCNPGEYMEMECSKGQATVCKPCPPGSYSHVPDNSRTCTNCTECEQVVAKKCTSITDTQCTCKDGNLCANRKCTKCDKRVVCPKGKELQKLGKFDFVYECKNCSTNTYSDTEGGRCQNLTVCEKLDKKEISPGNSTHNTICGPIAPPVLVNPESLAPYLSVIIVTSPLLLIFLISCLWKRNTKYITPTTMDQMENMLSCPLSKEEKGDLPIQAMDSKVSKPASLEQSLSAIA